VLVDSFESMRKGNFESEVSLFTEGRDLERIESYNDVDIGLVTHVLCYMF